MQNNLSGSPLGARGGGGENVTWLRWVTRWVTDRPVKVRHLVWDFFRESKGTGWWWWRGTLHPSLAAQLHRRLTTTHTHTDTRTRTRDSSCFKARIQEDAFLPGVAPPQSGMGNKFKVSGTGASASCSLRGVSVWAGPRGGGPTAQRWVSSLVLVPNSCWFLVPGAGPTGVSSGMWASGSDRMMYLGGETRSQHGSGAALWIYRAVLWNQSGSIDPERL